MHSAFTLVASELIYCQGLRLDCCVLNVQLECDTISEIRNCSVTVDIYFSSHLTEIVQLIRIFLLHSFCFVAPCDPRVGIPSGTRALTYKNRTLVSQDTLSMKVSE